MSPARKLDLARRELHNAALKLGAVANGRRPNVTRVREIEKEHEAAARKFFLAEQAAAAEVADIERSTV